jgi:hypothetical protein
MAFDLHPDPLLAASHRNMAAHLCGPFLAGAVDNALTVAADGTVTVPVAPREPLLLVAPAQPLGDVTMTVAAKLDPRGAASILAPLQFAPYTEAGAFVCLHAPAVNPDTRTTAPFTVQLTVAFRDRDGNAVATPVPDVSVWLQARLLEGTMGKLIYMMGLEQARLRRQAREICAMRNLSQARWDALDRFGAELAVPRFVDQIAYDKAKKEIVTQLLTRNGQPAAEPDGEYRRRLQLYYPWMAATKQNLLLLLNGPGADADANKSALGDMGFAPRFQLNEQDNAFAVAIHLVAPGAPNLRQNFLTFLLTHVLIRPADNAANNAAHQQRFVPSARRKQIEDLRTRLRAAFLVSADTAVAPMLATALDRVGRLRRALGAVPSLTITRAFDAAGGSRYELGLGVDIKPIAAAELDAMDAALKSANPPRSNDPEIAALIGALASKPAAADPLGTWLLGACGLKTVHQVNAGTVYLSHLPTFGLVIQEPAQPPEVRSVGLEAHYNAPGDPGANAVLVAALADGRQKWAAAGREAWIAVSNADARARWARNIAQPANAHNMFQAASLPAINSLPGVAPALNDLPDELFQAIQLGPALTNQILAGQAAAVDQLKALAALFRDEKVSSILPLVTGAAEITVLIGAIGLPQAGINLAQRRATGFRWYAVPVQGNGGTVSATSSRARFLPADNGLTAIIVVGYLRTGTVDPYEYRVELPAAARLNLIQYEYLMNALEHSYPLGIQVNTYSVRTAHVDLDGNGVAAPLPESVFRTYRRFRRRRQRGEVGPTL